MARPKKSEGGMSKMEAVRQTLAKHGKEIKPGEIVQYVKSDFGMGMSYDMASTYKGTILRNAGGKKRGRKPGRKPAAVTANGRKTGGITLEDIQAVKALADRLGAEKVQQLAAVLAK